MKNQILFACFYLITSCAFAVTLMQDPQTDKSFLGIFSFFLPAIVSSFIILLTDASKWWNTGLWSWSVFFNTKIKPFLLSLVVAVIIYLILLFVPYLQPFVEAIANYDLTEITGFALIGLATAVIDNLSKKAPSPEEQRAFSRNHDIVDEEEL